MKQNKSGSGSPDHTATIGSLYTDTITGFLYSYNKNLSWVPLETISHCEFHFQDNITIDTSMTTSWSKIQGTFLQSSVINGFSFETNTFTVKRPGNYLVKAAVSFYSVIADENIVRIGVGVNDESTDIQSTGFLYTGKPMDHVPISGTLNGLVEGDVISLIVKSDTTSAVITVKHLTIFMKKIL